MTCLSISNCALIFIIFMRASTSVYVEEPWTLFCTSIPLNEKNFVTEGNGKIELNPMIKDNYLVHLNTDPQYGIELDLTDFSLKNFFLVIQGVRDPGDGPTTSNIHFISGEGKKDEPIHFRIPFTKSFLIEVCPEEETTVVGLTNNKATVSFSRTEFSYEEPLPDNEDFKKEKESYEIQFKGKPPSSFKDNNFLITFYEIVWKIAYEYSERKNLMLDFNELPSTMVTVHAVHSCPAEWPEREICASVQHSVFARDKDNTTARVSSSYELTAVHLKEMWGELPNDHLKNIGLCMYQLPQKGIATGIWLALTIVPPLIALLLAYGAVRTYQYFMDDTININQTNDKTEKRDKRQKDKLGPNKYQTVPDFMYSQTYENDQSRIGENNYYSALMLPRYRCAQENSQDV